MMEKYYKATVIAIIKCSFMHDMHCTIIMGMWISKSSKENVDFLCNSNLEITKQHLTQNLILIVIVDFEQ